MTYGEIIWCVAQGLVCEPDAYMDLPAVIEACQWRLRDTSLKEAQQQRVIEFGVKAVKLLQELQEGRAG